MDWMDIKLAIDGNGKIDPDCEEYHKDTYPCSICDNLPRCIELLRGGAFAEDESEE